jgi:GTP cyclohydrolase IB
MKDTQSEPDQRGVAIDSVGVSGLRWPIIVWDQKREKQPTVATLKLSVALPDHFKGTHMSRFIEALNEHRGEITFRTLPQLVADLRQRLSAPSADVEVRFPYFVEKLAPVSKAPGLMDFDCWFRATGTDTSRSFTMGVKVPVTSLCPCSKSISDYGAHNQRGYISFDVRPTTEADGSVTLIWLEELISIAEQAASCPVYPLLKRQDERHVTMQAYDKPAFVEDMVRDCAVALRNDSRVDWFRVNVENHESIHNHAAFAEVEWRRS